MQDREIISCVEISLRDQNFFILFGQKDNEKAE